VEERISLFEHLDEHLELDLKSLLRILLRTKHITPSGITSVFLIRALNFPLLTGHHQGNHDFPMVSAYGIVGVYKN
jgi:hypothetical protein